MAHATRPLTGALLSAILSALLVTGGAVAPTFAVDSVPASAVDPGTTVQVNGTLTVYSGQEVAPGADVKTPLPDQVRLRTSSGASVLLTGELTTDVVSGSAFEGTLAVPADAAADINIAVESVLGTQRIAAGAVTEDSALGQEILTASDTLEVSLEVVAATITPPVVEAIQAPRAHTVDVAVVTLPGVASTSVITDASINTLVSTISTFWKSQSSGQIASVTRPLAAKRMVSASACDAKATWDIASAAFGDPSGNIYQNGFARHLVVLVPGDGNLVASCGAGTGLGSVGPSLNAGGVTWSTFESMFGTSTVAHEIGHNLGLRHSNAHVCEGSAVEGTPQGTPLDNDDACWDAGYFDFYDVMGGNFDFNGRANSQLPALNVTQKSRLGALSPADLPTLKSDSTVGSSTKTYALPPSSNTSGVRGLRVIDPKTGGEYFVEYRAGVGMDTGSIYASGDAPWMPVGVRILRIRVDGQSAVLSQPGPADSFNRQQALTAGKSLAIPSGALRFSVTSLGATAGLTVSFGSGTPTPAVDRISGADRYTTAVAISKKGFPGTAPVVYVATGANYPDALGAAPAATKEGGPLLLTPAASLPSVVQAEIARLKPGKIIVVGGTAAVSAKTFTQLQKLAPTVRLAGADRFETARKVVANAFKTPVPAAYIATGLNYPDALSASAAAGAAGIPVVLVNGGAKNVDAPTKALLGTLKATSLKVVGGTSAVSAGVATSLATVGTVTRISGTDRFDTSQKVNKAAFASIAHAYFATGFQFPDALAGAALAGAKKSPLYVVQSGCVPGGIRNDLIAFKTTAVTLIGGASALNGNVAALRPC